MILRRRHIRKSARIEMIPLIDIVFLLLVFFIYAMLSMAVHRGMEVELPVSSQTEMSEDIPLSISVQDRNGDAVIYLNKEPLLLEELEERLGRLTAGENKHKKVLLFADKSVSYQQLYKVLDQISGAGIIEISLQAELQR